MNDSKILPNVGTPEECRRKMMDGYASFLDIACKFIALGEVYTIDENKGKPLGDNFRNAYHAVYQKIKNASPEDFCYQMSFLALVYLSYIDEVKENLAEYQRLLKGDDPSLSEYDQCCDYLTVKDEFTDLSNTLKEINNDIAENREAESHVGDPEYDPNAKEIVQ